MGKAYKPKKHTASWKFISPTWHHLSKTTFKYSPERYPSPPATRRAGSINLEKLRGRYALTGNLSLDVAMTKQFERLKPDAKKHGLYIDYDRSPANVEQVREYLERPRNSGVEETRARGELIEKVRAEGVTTQETVSALVEFLKPRCRERYGQGPLEYSWERDGMRRPRKYAPDYYEHVDPTTFHASNIPTHLHAYALPSAGRSLPNFFLTVIPADDAIGPHAFHAACLAGFGARSMDKIQNHLAPSDNPMDNYHASVLAVTVDPHYVTLYTAQPSRPDAGSAATCCYTASAVTSYSITSRDRAAKAFDTLLNVQDWCYEQRARLMRRARDAASEQ